MGHFADNFEHESFKRNAVEQPNQKGPQYNQENSMVGKQRTTQTDGFKPTEKEVFVVASFNDWMPTRMKTIRTLTLEKFPMDTPEEEIPKQMFMLDN